MGRVPDMSYVEQTMYSTPDCFAYELVTMLGPLA